MKLEKTMLKRGFLVNVNVNVNVRWWKVVGGRCLKKIGVSR